MRPPIYNGRLRAVNTIGRVILAMLITLVLAGCSATGPIFQDAKAPSPGCGLVYIYRTSSFVYGGSDAYFYVDDINVADLSNNGYTAFHLPAGTYEFKQSWPLTVASSVTSPLALGAEEIQYFRLSTSTDLAAIYWEISRPDAEAGRRDIASRRYQEPHWEQLAKLSADTCK